MSVGVPVGPSGRVDSNPTATEQESYPDKNKGGDFSTSPRSESAPPARVGALVLARMIDELSERDRGVMGFVAEFRLASAEQLRRAFFPASEFATPPTADRCCRRVLHRLTRTRVLNRLERRVGGLRAGSDGFIYGLGPVGFRMTQPEGRSRPRAFEPSPQFIHHQLAVSHLAVELMQAARQDAVSALHLEGEPRSWRMLPGQRSRAGMLRPDMHVRLRSGDVEMSWFVEIDRGTTHVPALIRKCVLYESYYRAGVEQAEHGVFPRVIWVAPTGARAERIAAGVGRRADLTPGLFAVATTDAAVQLLRGEIDR